MTVDYLLWCFGVVHLLLYGIAGIALVAGVILNWAGRRFRLTLLFGKWLYEREKKGRIPG
jgi:hypothetical protein